MPAAQPPLIVQVHKWPWSFGVPAETMRCDDEIMDVDFAASPMLSCPTACRLNVEGRNEHFLPAGPTFTPSFQGVPLDMTLHLMPHGLIAPLGRRRLNTPRILVVSLGRTRKKFRILKTVNESPEAQNDIELERTILAWVNIYESFRDTSSQAAVTGEIPWRDVYDFILGLGKDEDEEPRRDLIVRIAEEMLSSLEGIVMGARRILERERQMLPAPKLGELDHACIHWYVRQPGYTPAQKAAVNNQQLLGVARKETYDTLENRVLKDFLRRCSDKARKYLVDECTGSKQNSRRAARVRTFKVVCDRLLCMTHLEDVKPVKGIVQANYVLQNDLRYRKLWDFYLRLLRQEDDEDKLWTWQNRTWSEIAALMLHTTLFVITEYSESSDYPFRARSLAASSLKVLREQLVGCFLDKGTEPGPWLVSGRGKKLEDAAVLEIVPGELADRHPLTQGLAGRLGSWELLTITPLNNRKKVTIIVLWATHLAGLDQKYPTEDMRASAEEALKKHETICNDFNLREIALRGLILSSTLHDEPDFFPGDNVHAAVLQAKPELWSKNIEMLELLVEDLLEKTL